MNMRDVARDSYHLATSMEECPLDSFWVVLLDDGTEVYQSEHRKDLAEGNPWMRLKQFCAKSGRKIMHMAYAFRNNNREIVHCVPEAMGYFFANRVRTLAAPDPRVAGYTDSAIGIGYLRHNILTINWIRNDGVIEQENRDILKTPIPFTLICN